jgi:hypothetical protein
LHDQGCGGAVGLRDQGVPWDAKTTDAAAEGEHFELLKLCYEQGCPVSESTLSFVAERGDIATTRWLLQHGCARERACDGAASGGHLELLKMCREEWGCPWGASTCSSAASGGHLELLKWMRQRPDPCPWDEETCESAASGDRLEVLQWCRANGAPWDHKVCSASAQSSKEVRDYIHQQGCPMCIWTMEEFGVALYP